MKKISGFVCVAEVNNPPLTTWYLFGPSSSNCQYESFETNGLEAFDSIREATQALRELQKRKVFQKVWIARLEMEIAKLPEEMDLPEIVSSDSLVVILETESGSQLMGREIEGMPSAYPLYGAFLLRNGLQPIASFESARYIASEANRQSGGAPVSIATFSLTRIP